VVGAPLLPVSLLDPSLELVPAPVLGSPLAPDSSPPAADVVPC